MQQVACEFGFVDAAGLGQQFEHRVGLVAKADVNAVLALGSGHLNRLRCQLGVFEMQVVEPLGGFVADPLAASAFLQVADITLRKPCQFSNFSLLEPGRPEFFYEFLNVHAANYRRSVFNCQYGDPFFSPVRCRMVLR